MEEKDFQQRVEKLARILIRTLRQHGYTSLEFSELYQMWTDAVAGTGNNKDSGGFVLKKCVELLKEKGEITLEEPSPGFLITANEFDEVGSDTIVHIVPSRPAPGPRPGPQLVLKSPPPRPERPPRSAPALSAPTPVIDIAQDPVQYLNLALVALRKVGRSCGQWYALGEADTGRIVHNGVMHASRHQAEKLTAKLQSLGLLLVCPTGCCHVKAQPERIDSSLIGTWL